MVTLLLFIFYAKEPVPQEGAETYDTADQQADAHDEQSKQQAEQQTGQRVVRNMELPGIGYEEAGQEEIV